MIPTFSRNWLIKIAVVLERFITPASLRIAFDIKRACRPTDASPISPSNSACGTSAATESITTKSIAPDLINTSVISNACSPESGCDNMSSSISTPNFLA